MKHLFTFFIVLTFPSFFVINSDHRGELFKIRVRPSYDSPAYAAFMDMNDSTNENWDIFSSEPISSPVILQSEDDDFRTLSAVKLKMTELLSSVSVDTKKTGLSAIKKDIENMVEKTFSPDKNVSVFKLKTKVNHFSSDELANYSDESYFNFRNLNLFQINKQALEKKSLSGNKLTNSSDSNFVTSIPTQSGEPILVSLPYKKNTTKFAVSSPFSYRNNGKVANNKGSENSKVQRSDKNIENNFITASANAFQSQSSFSATHYFTKESYTITGSLELTGGLIVTDNDYKIKIRQNIFGQKFKWGQVDVEQARFHINVENLVGDLEAIILDPQGQVIGRSVYSLNQFPVHILRSENLKNAIHLKLEPIEFGIELEVVSADSFFGEKKNITNARVFIDQLEREIIGDKDFIFKHEDILHPSSYLVRVEAPNYWGTLQTATSQSKNYISMYSISHMNQIVKSLDKEEKDYLSGGVIVGKVVDQMGNAISQAKVETSFDYNKVHYFSKFLPDAFKLETDQEGKFIIFDLVDGEAEIRVKVGDKIFPAQRILVKKGFVTETEVVLNFVGQEINEFVPFELFTEIPLESEIQLLGQSQLLNSVNTKPNIEMGNQYSAIIDTGNDYELMHHYSVFFKNRREVPVLPVGWLEYVKDKNKLKNYSNAIRFLGVLKSSLSYEVFLDGQPVKTLFFDSDGDLVSEKQRQKGKSYGFVLFDVTPGFHSIQISIEDGAEIFNHFTYIKQDQISSYYFDIPKLLIEPPNKK